MLCVPVCLIRKQMNERHLYLEIRQESRIKKKGPDRHEEVASTRDNKEI